MYNYSRKEGGFACLIQLTYITIDIVIKGRPPSVICQESQKTNSSKTIYLDSSHLLSYMSIPP
jgi:hypothetical protein